MAPCDIDAEAVVWGEHPIAVGEPEFSGSSWVGVQEPPAAVGSVLVTAAAAVGSVETRTSLSWSWPGSVYWLDPTARQSCGDEHDTPANALNPEMREVVHCPSAVGVVVTAKSP